VNEPVVTTCVDCREPRGDGVPAPCTDLGDIVSFGDDAELAAAPAMELLPVPNTGTGDVPALLSSESGPENAACRRSSSLTDCCFGTLCRCFEPPALSAANPTEPEGDVFDVAIPPNSPALASLLLADNGRPVVPMPRVPALDAAAAAADGDTVTDEPGAVSGRLGGGCCSVVGVMRAAGGVDAADGEMTVGTLVTTVGRGAVAAATDGSDDDKAVTGTTGAATTDGGLLTSSSLLSSISSSSSATGRPMTN
jgi:hypothetical protein